MSFWFWNGASLASALVDSALAGSHEDAWLSWTLVSLPARGPATPTTSNQKTSTSHLVTRPVRRPAICRCMDLVQQIPPTAVIGVYPEFTGVCRIVVGRRGRHRYAGEAQPYRRSITSAYLVWTTRRFSFRVGVSSSDSAVHSTGSSSNDLTC